MSDRKLKNFFAAFLMLVLAPFAAVAQVTHWVQIEAHATLRTAEEFAARYESRIGNIAGFRIAGGWYALAVGPFATAEDAEFRRGQLLATREIREDSYTTDNVIYGQQFWPAGALGAPQPVISVDRPVASQDTGNTAPATTETPVVETPVVETPVVETPVAEAPVVPAQPAIEDLPDETVTEARANERNLTRDDRFAIQIALQWFGFYRSLIDADFGPGTRNAIAAWQVAQGAGWVEGWRGEILVALEMDAHGRIERCHCHDPSWQNWPVLEHAVIGNIVPDFPLINKSFNLSYSGHDL